MLKKSTEKKAPNQQLGKHTQQIKAIKLKGGALYTCREKCKNNINIIYNV